MASIYELALGADFHKLHPRIQQRFGFNSEDRIASIGHGVMEYIWYNKWVSAPLYLGTSRHIMFPQGGRQVPFSIENFAYRDRFGRETVTWIRKFKFPNTIRHFDATMIYSKKRERIVDYLGTKQHLAVDLSITADDNGGIRIRSGDQRFYEGLMQFKFPQLFTAVAEVNEWYDDSVEKYRISVEVTNPVIGKVFRYLGSFEAQFIDMNHVPLDCLPLREESRE
ncbi:MAG: DUF4166 domain-containing protein [Candidatus Pristimantibacillus sp.]